MKVLLQRTQVLRSNNSTKIYATGSFEGPYPTSGGKVPIYSTQHGIVQKRYWIYKNSNWCELCREPVALWVNHMGRKDHALMDLHYSALVEYPRRWNPEEFAHSVADDLGVDISTFQSTFGAQDQVRRNELYAMLVELEDAGLLYFGEPRHTFVSRMQGSFRGNDHQGSLVLHHHLLGPFTRLFPNGHIQDYSNLLDFITCNYNMETVYDLCAFYTLDTVAIKANYKASSPAAVGLGGAAAASAASSGFDQQASPSTTMSASAEELARTQEEEAFSRKAVFVRQLLGQLRWVTLPNQEHPAGYTFPPYIITLAEICLKALIAEIVLARLCEYMVRAEPVWQQCGFERKTVNLSETAKERGDVRSTIVRYVYRTASDEIEDLYSMTNNSMETELEQALKRKGLDVPKDSIYGESFAFHKKRS